LRLGKNPSFVIPACAGMTNRKTMYSYSQVSNS